MRKRKLLIADTDEAYLRSLCAYLAGSRPDLAVTTCSDVSVFSEYEGHMDISVLSPEFYFLPAARKLSGRVLCLLSEKESMPEGVESVYKFQPADVFLSKITGDVNTGEGSGAGPFVISVCSPIHHELRLPFALALARIYGESGRTLFLDLTETSILMDLFRQSMEREEASEEDEDNEIVLSSETPDLIDLIYDLESSGERTIPDRFVYEYDGFSYLPPAGDAELLSEVTKEQWGDLMSAIKNTDYCTVVILSDHLPGHFSEWSGESGEVILLSKNGDFYRKSEKKYEDWLNARLPNVRMREVELPMSASNLSDGSWYLDSLLDGNLGRFVREKVMTG